MNYFKEFVEDLYVMYVSSFYLVIDNGYIINDSKKFICTDKMDDFIIMQFLFSICNLPWT